MACGGMRLRGDPANKPETRYSPAQCVGTRRDAIIGNPDPEHVSTRLRGASESLDADGDAPIHAANHAFSKKLENHMHALSICFMHYNFLRIHQTLRTPPAMAAGVVDTLWSLEDIVRIVDEWEASQKDKESA